MKSPKFARAFAGVDGEGGDIDDRHEYTLLRAGDYLLTPRDGDRLTSMECLAFLADLPVDRIYVSYFFDYDVTMICRGLPEGRIVRLLDRESRQTAEGLAAGWGPLPVDVGEFQIDYLPHKEFRVRRKGGQWRLINDTGTFFQASFVNTLGKWSVVSAEDLERIAEGKAQRGTFGALEGSTEVYNRLEVTALECLMEAFRDACRAVGYVPLTWQGPGSIASTMLRRHKIPKSSDLGLVPDLVWRMAQGAYYGGRFETTAVGQIPGPVFQYDINSAYPDACRALPCLRHSAWSTEKPRRYRYSVSLVRFRHPTNVSLCGLPIRMEDGSIRYPREGRGWYWNVETDAAERAGAAIWEYDHVYCEEGCDCRPFDWVHELYLARQAMGRDAKGIVLKLALNSIYGKLAQSIGQAPYGNPVWAGLITAITRAKLIDAYRQAFPSVVMLATDGVFSTAPLVLPIGDGLGMWSETVLPDLHIVQPGVYFTSDPETKPKTRGVPMRAILEREAEFRAVWEGWNRAGRPPSVSIPVRNFIGLRLAYARGRPETAGQWVDAEKVVSYDWSTKRTAAGVRDGIWRTHPYAGDFGLVTVPYQRLIGNMAKDYERLQWDDLPDWADAWMP